MSDDANLELLYRLDSSQVYAQNIIEFDAQGGGPLVLDGEVDIHGIYDALFEHDANAVTVEVTPSTGRLVYRNTSVYYGGAAYHPSLSTYPRLTVGSPVSGRRVPAEISEREPERRGLFQRLFRF